MWPWASHFPLLPFLYKTDQALGRLNENELHTVGKALGGNGGCWLMTMPVGLLLRSVSASLGQRNKQVAKEA